MLCLVIVSYYCLNSEELCLFTKLLWEHPNQLAENIVCLIS